MMTARVIVMSECKKVQCSRFVKSSSRVLCKTSLIFCSSKVTEETATVQR